MWGCGLAERGLTCAITPDTRPAKRWGGSLDEQQGDQVMGVAFLACHGQRPTGVRAGGEDINAAGRGAGPHEFTPAALLRPAAGVGQCTRAAAGEGEGLVMTGKEKLALKVKCQRGKATAPEDRLRDLAHRHVEPQQQRRLVLVEDVPHLCRLRRERRAGEAAAQGTAAVGALQADPFGGDHLGRKKKSGVTGPKLECPPRQLIGAPAPTHRNRG